MSTGRRGAGRAGPRSLVFLAVLAGCVAGAVGYALHAASRTAPAARAAATPAAAAPALAALPAGRRPWLLFRNTSVDALHGRIGLRFIDAGDDGDGRRFVTPLSCERVHVGGGRGVCLQAVRGALTRYRLRIFDRRFHIEHSVDLAGPPSRARMSPDGRLAAVTVFLRGHGYAGADFSTRTSVLDAATGQWVVDDLERWEVRRDGRPLRAADVNFWGVTFARDGRRFYATLRSGGRFELVEGDLAARSMRVVHEGVECPSLSPDGTRIAFKRRSVTGPAGRFTWRLHVLELATGRETLLAGETRSVDDQVEWLDDTHIAYALPAREDGATAATNVWRLRVDAGARPQEWVPLAASPAVGR